MKKLVICEKPSVGKSIAKVLGVSTNKDGYMENENYIITWCIGHLVGLSNTDVYNEKYAKWNLEDLPIIPNKFEFTVPKDKEKQFSTVSKLLQRKDVEYVVNACDAGREGELIFRLVYNKAGSTIPIKRLWISSMEDVAIKKGFENLKDGKEFENLYQAALCRLKADWIVGINSTRLFSCVYNQSLNVGRVMSPTLSMIVMRNTEIEMFIPKPFYNISFENDEVIFTSKKTENKEEVETMLDICNNNSLIIENVESKEKSVKPPKLFDLTTLQRVANRILGFSASQTLDCVQHLYEKKLCTYPRTDSNFLTEDMEDGLIEILDMLSKKLDVNTSSMSSDKSRIKSVINNSKVTDHHAIIPTMLLENYDIDSLPYAEKEVLNLINLRLMESLSADYKYNETVITAKCKDITFKTRGKAVVDTGFKKFESSSETTKTTENLSENNKDVILPLFNIGEKIENAKPSISEGKTAPPKQFTEDTILSSMERAGQKEKVEKEFCGIGTPATRASILEKLVNIEFIKRDGDKKTKHLVPTDTGSKLIAILPELIHSPLLTAKWEEKLKQIENGELSSATFMEEISTFITDLVSNYEKVKNSEELFPKKEFGNSKYKAISKCPRCQSDVLAMPKAYSCSNRDCSFVIFKESKIFTNKNKTITDKVAKELIENGRTKLTKCVSAKSNKTYDCTIILEDTGEKYVNFKTVFDN